MNLRTNKTVNRSVITAKYSRYLYCLPQSSNHLDNLKLSIIKIRNWIKTYWTLNSK